MDNQTDIYLDIDGVLLANSAQSANYANNFLRKVLGEFPDSTYWLTTHCNGDATAPMRNIGRLFDVDVQALMRNIKPTSWEIAKTEAIDFGKPFLWFDDDLFPEERQVLLQYNALGNWIEVNLASNPNQLARFIDSFPLPVIRRE